MSPLSAAVLLETFDDWVPLAAIDGLARQRVGEVIADRREAMLGAISELVALRYVDVGVVLENEGFVARESSGVTVLDEIAEILSQDEPDLWWFERWLCITPLGETYLREGSGTSGKTGWWTR